MTFACFTITCAVLLAPDPTVQRGGPVSLGTALGGLLGETEAQRRTEDDRAP